MQSWIVSAGIGLATVACAETPPPTPIPMPPSPSPAPTPAPTPLATTPAPDKPYPITLAVALQLVNAKPLDIALAAQQVELATRHYERAKLLWVPNLMLGTDYFRHEGGQQNFAGEILRSNRHTFMAGFGPNLVVSSSDAIFAPLAARQDLLARTAWQQATTNDTTLAVAEAYMHVQQARAELAGATFAVRNAETVSAKVTALAEGLVPPLESNRARIELARRRQAVASATESWRIASAELTRLLRLEYGVTVEPSEPATLPIRVIADDQSPDVLVPIALTNRPELAAHQALVQATLTRLKQEKYRPLTPSVAIRSVSTNPSGSLGYGVFGGGVNDRMNQFGSRFDIDVQLVWEFSALGLGNRVRINERRVESYAATLELFRMQDRIAAEVVTAHAQLVAASERLNEAEPAYRDAVELVTKSIDGMGQTRRVGEYVTLVIRPQEVVAALQIFAQANSDYARAVGDHNRAQFRLYRALGHPPSALQSVVTP
jgi:outer membrane protein TolC